MRGFVRIAAAVPTCAVANVQANVEATLSLWRRAHDEDHALVVFPELGLTSYTARDLFHDHHLLRTALEGLQHLAHIGRDLAPLAVVGLPLRTARGVYNVAVALQGGRARAVVPKCYLPTYREFEEARWFRPGVEVPAGASLDLGPVLGHEVPFGTDVLLQADAAPGLTVGLEICEDFWVAVPPSALQVLAGATVVANLSASNFIVGKAELRRLLAQASSDRGKCAYVYVAAGPGESSTDLAFDADAFIVENGRVLASSTRFAREPQLVSVDVDLERLERERMVTNTFGDCGREHAKVFRRVSFSARDEVSMPLLRTVPRHPFVPQDPATLGARCWEIFEIQTNALATRMSAIGRPRLVLGVSGGLDSTHAALVAATALDLRGQPRSELLCVTMPGLGTTEGTRGNAERLVEALGAELRVISISEATRMVLQMLGHAAVEPEDDADALVARLRQRPELGDVTLENVQARLRTLVLMCLANAHGGLVVGTGDLSEKALGWSTYAGDHIAMYDVNAGVPKTLIQSVIRWVANERVGTWSQGDVTALRQTLFAILDTPISPELLPADADGKIAQLTEAHLGPYELHDFFLYHFVRDGARPERVLDLARVAFGDDYPVIELQRWLTLFLRRFFTQQFKRSCTADGPKVGQVALSPRGDWRMPSDARVDEWLAEVAAYQPE
ncbi:NAD(+) synthase [Paraliomyxa miuraensis]|uniref:NAD(+) synthase n=1 Tax=Paraliomyxa miuraensis TaxID=376150 RepID=UPI002256BEAB|nr:NAD(+) synthase [Paraliomyxa miuraensis]MCX4247482.1 NAD(+) synthase [Paraliomyxa miuraensis]